MEFLYMILTFVLVMLSVYVLHKRTAMKVEQKKLKLKYKEIEKINKQLDDLSLKLESFSAPLSKVNDISTKIISFRK